MHMHTGGHLRALYSSFLHLILFLFLFIYLLAGSLIEHHSVHPGVSYDACGSFVDTAHPSPWGQDYRYAK